MEALGRLFNVHPVADDVYINMKGAAAVTFVLYATTGEIVTLTEAKDAAGTGAQVLSTITDYYTSATVGAVWLRATQAAASTVGAQTADVVCVCVAATELSDTYTHVKLAGASTGTIVAITHDLVVQRAPQNLPAIGA